MSVWLHLIPKLHNAGANNIFPAHNAFTGHDDPSLFAGVVRPSSFSHGYQVKLKFKFSKEATKSSWNFSQICVACLECRTLGEL